MAWMHMQITVVSIALDMMFTTSKQLDLAYDPVRTEGL